MKRYLNQEPEGFPWKRLPLALAIGLSLSGAAVAQDQAASEGDEAETQPVVEEVVVSGFRRSLVVALDNKRESTNAVDSIYAEDIADFPDLNLAEALQRIPGVAITREAGEGRNITVRGLDAKFTRVLINDTMAQSLAAGSGGSQSNRSFDFNVFASELFNRIDVYKSTSAEMEEGSLGATVKLQTGRPFDYGEGIVTAANLQASYNDQSSETSPRFSGLFSWTNANETFGALASISYSERYVNNTGPQTGRWENDNFMSCTACSSESEQAQVFDAYHPRFPRYADKTHDHERLGITGSLQFRPIESTTLTADVLIANIDARREEPFMQAISLARTGSTGVQETDIAAYELDGPTIISATMDGVDTRAENFVSLWDTDFEQYSLRWDQDFGDRMRLTGIFATSESVLDNRETTLIFEHYSPNDPRRYATYAESAAAVMYDYSRMLAPTIAYDYDTTNPANWEVSEFRDRIHDATSGFDNLKLDFAWDVTDWGTLKVGYSWKEYSFDQMQTRADRSFQSADGRDGTVDGVACGISYLVDSSMGSVVRAGKVDFFMADESQFDRFRDNSCWPQGIRTGDTRKVVEEDTGYYLQFDFMFDLAGHDLRGNVGVREVETDLKSTGITSVDGDLLEVTVPAKYDDTLPAMNLAFNVTDDLIARASWAKVMSRPDLGLLSPGGNVTIFGVPAVSYGNPFLEPYRADNMDLSVEWYFSENSVLALAYFDKDIESFPDSETVLLPWDEVGLPDSVLGAQYEDLKDETFEVTRRINGGGASLNGWELQYQQQFTFLPGFMQNTGIIANYTWVDSKVDETGLALTGQSDDSYNVTVYYDDDKFSARLAYSYRGEFTTRNDNLEDRIRYRDSTANLDFTASYRFTDSWRATFEVINWTDEPQIDWMSPNVGGRLIETQYTGTYYLLGVSYTY